MKTLKQSIALIEVLLVFPAVLFMTALFVRSLQPAQYEPARSALRLVNWFSARPILGLDIFLIALPLAALLIGCAAVLRAWRADAELRRAALQTLGVIRAHLSPLLIAGATLAAAVILGIVALHLITD